MDMKSEFDIVIELNPENIEQLRRDEAVTSDIGLEEGATTTVRPSMSANPPYAEVMADGSMFVLVPRHRPFGLPIRIESDSIYDYTPGRMISEEGRAIILRAVKGN